jgi:hypothetical protein
MNAKYSSAFFCVLKYALPSSISFRHIKQPKSIITVNTLGGIIGLYSN